MKLSPREGVYYAAWMAGIIATVTVSRAMGIHHLIGLILGLGIGFCLGIAAEKAYDRYTNQSDTFDQNDQWRA